MGLFHPTTSLVASNLVWRSRYKHITRRHVQSQSKHRLPCSRNIRLRMGMGIPGKFESDTMGDTQIYERILSEIRAINTRGQAGNFTRNKCLSRARSKTVLADSNEEHEDSLVAF
eukprot:s292_g5.t1